MNARLTIKLRLRKDLIQSELPFGETLETVSKEQLRTAIIQYVVDYGYDILRTADVKFTMSKKNQ